MKQHLETKSILFLCALLIAAAAVSTAHAHFAVPQAVPADAGGPAMQAAPVDLPRPAVRPASPILPPLMSPQAQQPAWKQEAKQEAKPEPPAEEPKPAGGGELPGPLVADEPKG